MAFSRPISSDASAVKILETFKFSQVHPNFPSFHMRTRLQFIRNNSRGWKEKRQFKGILKQHDKATLPGQKHLRTPGCNSEAGTAKLSKTHEYSVDGECHGPATKTFMPPCEWQIRKISNIMNFKFEICFVNIHLLYYSLDLHYSKSNVSLKLWNGLKYH